MLWNCNKGLTLIEVICTLSIWLLLCSSLLPHLMTIIIERKNAEIQQIGNSILSDELQLMFHTEVLLPTEKFVTRNNITYIITVKKENGSQLREVCISWSDKLERNREKCGYVYT